MASAESRLALLSLRPAQAADEAFLFRLFGDTQDHLSLLRSNEALWNVLVDVQYRGRKTTYETNYPAAEDFVLCRGGEAVGRLLINREVDCLRILDIAILADFRGQGIGSWAVRQWQLQAEEIGARIELSVNPANPARWLYERLGFRATDEDTMQVAMAWRSPSTS